MDRIFSAVQEHLEAGEEAVLCRVVNTAGSTPRGPGARMAVFSSGSAQGTVGGGAVELQTTVEALRSLRHRRRGFCVSYSLAPVGGEGDIGMICGGEATVLLQLLTPADAPLIAEAARAAGSGESAWLVTEFTGDGVWTMSVVRQGPEELLQGQPVFQPGQPARYAEPLSRRGTVYLFGAGHVSRELVPLLERTDFPTVVWDDRPELARPELFPGAVRVISGGYETAADQLAVTERDYVVVMTHGHQSDQAVLAFALGTKAAYIGCIGSRRKAAAVNQRLLEAGFSQEAVQRIHSPIGLPIGGETPAEIAVSIAAELIACRSALEGRKWGHTAADGAGSPLGAEKD